MEIISNGQTKLIKDSTTMLKKTKNIIDLAKSFGIHLESLMSDYVKKYMKHKHKNLMKGSNFANDLWESNYALNKSRYQMYLLS